MTREREIEIEGRVSALETEMEQLKRIVHDNSAFLRNFAGSTTGGIVVALVTWWIARG